MVRTEANSDSKTALTRMGLEGRPKDNRLKSRAYIHVQGYQTERSYIAGRQRHVNECAKTSRNLKQRRNVEDVSRFFVLSIIMLSS